MAPAAPGNATTARVWPENVWRRTTMNQPMALERDGNDRSRDSALTMKW